jgi:hypothetical protein
MRGVVEPYLKKYQKKGYFNSFDGAPLFYYTYCQADAKAALVISHGFCEFAEKYLKQGTKIVVTGRIQTGSYTNRDGQKVYTTDVVIEEQEFAESKKAAGEQAENAGYTDAGDGFMNIPDDIDGDLPFM